jgi:hypothetical protein
MDYFCYISRTKIDQLYGSNVPQKFDEYTEQRTTEQDIDGNVEAGLSIGNIINLFKGGITYGRKGVIQREMKVKIEYVEKLRQVMLAIAKDRPIPSLTESIRLSKFNSLYYHYQGAFRIEEALTEAQVDKVITLRSTVLSRTLLLDCSLRFFSEGNQPDGMFPIHSANMRFFAGDIDLQLETVFLQLNQKAKKIFGTPLFLKLSTDDVDVETIL